MRKFESKQLKNGFMLSGPVMTGAIAAPIMGYFSGGSFTFSIYLGAAFFVLSIVLEVTLRRTSKRRLILVTDEGVTFPHLSQNSISWACIDDISLFGPYSRHKVYFLLMKPTSKGCLPPEYSDRLGRPLDLIPSAKGWLEPAPPRDGAESLLPRDCLAFVASAYPEGHTEILISLRRQHGLWRSSSVNVPNPSFNGRRGTLR